MKIAMIPAYLALIATLPALANSDQGLRQESESRGNGNPITIYNHTKHHIVYEMSTFGMFNGTYTITRGGSDVYRSKEYDEYATFKVGYCKKVDWFFGYCEDDPSPLENCVNGEHYNADHIKTIHINSSTSCTVTCLDGSTTSCKQSG
jgi:hypothetical protein